MFPVQVLVTRFPKSNCISEKRKESYLITLYINLCYLHVLIENDTAILVILEFWDFFEKQNKNNHVLILDVPYIVY